MAVLQNYLKACMRYDHGICSSDGSSCREMCFQWVTCDQDIIDDVVATIKKFDSTYATRIHNLSHVEWVDLLYLNDVLRDSVCPSARDRPNVSSGHVQGSLSSYQSMEKGDEILNARKVLEETEEALKGLDRFA